MNTQTYNKQLRISFCFAVVIMALSTIFIQSTAQVLEDAQITQQRVIPPEETIELQQQKANTQVQIIVLAKQKIALAEAEDETMHSSAGSEKKPLISTIVNELLRWVL